MTVPTGWKHFLRGVRALSLVTPLALLVTFAGAGNAQVLFTNFGPSHAFNTMQQGPEFCGSVWVAVQFQPSVSAYFQDASIALYSLINATGGPDGTIYPYVYLYSDNSGVPGTILEGPITVTATGSPSVITALSTVHPSLTAGTPYWLVVSSINVPTSQCVVWLNNTTGDGITTTNFAGSTTSSTGPWVSGGTVSGPRPVFEIDGVQIAGNGAPFQVRYASHLDIGDSVINISNDGESQAPGYGIGSSGGTNLCVGVYTFDANEELQSCCSCLVTPNGLSSLSAQALTASSLTGEKPTSLVVKLLAWSTTAGASSTAPPGTPAPPTSSSCNPATPGRLAAGMHAWGTTVHPLPAGGPSTYTVTETEFSPAALSAAEFAHITQSCEFNQINGSAQSGQCKGCTSGGQ